MRKKIEIERITHKKEERIKLSFSYDTGLISLVRGFPDSRWSRTHKAWHLPFKETLISELKKTFCEITPIPELIINDNVANRETVTNKQLVDFDSIQDTAENLQLVGQFRKWLEHRRYSPSTISSYTDSVRIFLRYLHPKSAKEVIPDDMVKFVNEYIIKNGYSYSYQNQIINGTKLFFREIIAT